MCAFSSAVVTVGLARAGTVRYCPRAPAGPELHEEEPVSQLSPEDRLAIHEVLAAYCHAIDFGRWDNFPSLFTDDCRLDFGSVMGVFEGRDGIARFVDMMRGLGLLMRHYTTNVVVSGDGGRARAESYVLAVTGPPGSSHQTTGRYEDELVKRDGRWHLRVRRALLDTPA